MANFPGSNLDDVITGTSFGDTITGQGGDDELYGMGSNDIIDGGTGNDRIDGGTNDDNLTGGSGNDDFVFGSDRAFGSDIITDFTIGSDKINLSLLGIGDFSQLAPHITQAGLNTVITFGYGNASEIITINNVSAGSLTAASFTFNTSASGLTQTGGNFNDVLFGGNGNDTVIGNGGNDILSGGNGNDTLDGGVNSDTLTGGAGNDIFSFGLDRAFGPDTITDFTAGDRIDLASMGIGEFSQIQPFIAQVSVNTVITLGYGNSTETITINNVTASTLTAGSFIFNTLTTPKTQTGGNFNDVIFGGLGNDTLNGNGGNDTMSAGSGNDVLDGGNNNDVLTGGAGNDIFVFGSDRAYGTDTITDFTAGDRIDVSLLGITDFSQIQLILTQAGADAKITMGYGNGDESITLTNASAGQLTAASFIFSTVNTPRTVSGQNFNDMIFGGNGDDTIDGGFGNDTMVGGLGNDTYTGESAGDVALEAADGGFDTFRTSRNSMTLMANVETLIYTGASSFVGAGNVQDNIIIGGNANDVLVGYGGNDTLVGGVGNDEMIGGTGDDIYQDVTGTDSIVELNGEGIDTATTSVAVYTLASNVEILTYTGGSSFLGLGNSGDNVITGGASGDDLFGRDGNDTLNNGGGSAADTMLGGLGNDVYNITVAGTSTIELASQGIDEVRTAFGIYGLQANVENLTFTDGGNHGAGVGNVLDNVIKGSTGVDSLFGREGNDNLHGGTGSANTLLGQEGDDTYHVEAVGDSVIEFGGQGNDTVVTTVANFTLSANVENLTFVNGIAHIGIGNTLDNMLTGSSGSDFLSAGDGNDILAGLSGADELTGGAGADQFRYAGNETGVDRIYDFQSGTDKIALLASGYTPTATIGFVQSGAPAALDAVSTFLYNTNTGILSYDDDGSGAGAAVQIAQLNAGLNLSVSDFMFF